MTQRKTIPEITTMKAHDQRKTQVTPVKKAYRSPTLKEYGDIRAVTKAGQPTGMGDNSPGGISKSAFI